MKIYLTYLTYDIMFNDADYGDSWAGDGTFILKAFDSEKKAQSFIDEWKSIFQNALKENKRQLFPRLANQKLVHELLGMDLYDICDNMEELNINYRVMKIE